MNEGDGGKKKGKSKKAKENLAASSGADSDPEIRRRGTDHAQWDHHSPCLLPLATNIYGSACPFPILQPPVCCWIVQVVSHRQIVSNIPQYDYPQKDEQ